MREMEDGGGVRHGKEELRWGRPVKVESGRRGLGPVGKMIERGNRDKEQNGQSGAMGSKW
jgi:hypothetical protein